MMQLLIKVSLSVAIILLATFTAKRFPSIAGLIGHAFDRGLGFGLGVFGKPRRTQRS